jgi:hypothetical protein
MTSESSPSAMTTTRVDAIVGFLEGAKVTYELIEHKLVMSAAAKVADICED